MSRPVFGSAAIAVALLASALPAVANPKAELAKMQAALDARHQYACAVHDGDGSDEVQRTSPGHYKLGLRSGTERTVTTAQIAGLEPKLGRMIVLCDSGGLGFSPLSLATVADAGPMHKFGLTLHAYRVVAGSDATRSTSTVRIWPGHKNLPIETFVKDADGSVTLEYGEFDNVMAHP